MTSPSSGPKPPASQPARPGQRLAPQGTQAASITARATGQAPSYWPNSSTPSGAVLYAAIGGFIACLIMSLPSHVHFAITWPLRQAAVPAAGHQDSPVTPLAFLTYVIDEVCCTR